MTTFNSAEDAYAAVDTEVQRRFEANPELRQAFAGMDDASRSEFKHQAISHISEGYRVATGRTRPVWDIHATPYSPSTEAPITRKLQSPAIEQRWSALHSGEIGLEDLSPEQAKELQTIAKDQEPELVEYLKTDPQYLRHYAKAIEDYKGVLESGDFKWTKDMAWNPVQRSLIAKEGESYTARDRGAVAEFGRKLIGSFADLGMAVPQWMERRKRVEFGNPEGLKPGEIRERADAAAFADLLPYYVGTRNLQDDADLTGWEKAGGAGGTLFSFFVGSPNKLAFDAGMKAGAKGAGALAASKLVTNPKTYDALTKGWQRRLMTYGAGGAALGAKNTLIDPAPANQSESLGEFAGRLAKTAGKDAAVGMAFGEALHYGLAGLGYAWAKTGAPSPFMRAAQKSSAQEFTNSFYRMARRVDEGTANKTERETFANFSKWAEQQGVDMSKLRKGELGVEMTRLIPREWTAAHPALREALPNSMTRMKPKRTDVPGQKRLDAETSSRHTGPIPEAPARPPMPQRTAGETALPGQVTPPAKPVSPAPIDPKPAPASSPATVGATATGARPRDIPSQPSTEKPAAPTPATDLKVGNTEPSTVTPKRKRFKMGLPANQEPDLLNWIAEEGGIKTKSQWIKEQKAKGSYDPTTGGEYDGLMEATNSGPARLLRSKQGMEPDRMLQALEQHGYKFESVDDLYDAISKAGTQREATAKKVERDDYMGKTEAAFMDNEGRAFGQRTGASVRMADLKAGDSFEIKGEKFEIKEFLEDGRVRIEDGREFIVEPELEVFVDRGQIEAAPYEGAIDDPFTGQKGMKPKEYVEIAALEGKAFDAKLLDEPGVALPKGYQVKNGRAEPRANKAQRDKQLSAKQAKVEKNRIIQSEKNVQREVIAEEVAAGRINPSDLPEDYFVQLYREQLGATNQELAKQGNTAELPADYYGEAKPEVVSNDTKPREQSELEAELADIIKEPNYSSDPVERAAETYKSAVDYEEPLVICIGCAQGKLPGAHKAKDIYDSQLFRKRWDVAQKIKAERDLNGFATDIVIISAKHHVLDPEKVIENYDTRLSGKKSEKEFWGVQTTNQLIQRVQEKFGAVGDVRFELHMGQDYAEPVGQINFRNLQPSSRGGTRYRTVTPTEGLGIGQQLKYYNTQLSQSSAPQSDLIPNDDFKLTNEDAADSSKALDAERAKRQQEQDQGKLFDTGDVRGMEGEAYVQQQTEGYNTNQGPLGEAPVAGENIPPKDDANYSELPIEMPEMVQLYRSLLGGKYPQIAKKLGNALGVFRHTDGPKGEGHVELLASIFKLITPQQEQELMKQAMAKAQAEMPDADLGDPAVSKLARDIYEQLLRKATDEAKTKPPVLGSKVLAHEIMHLVDWLPNKMIQGRGNLLGRIKSAKGYLKHHLNPWEIGPQNQLTNKDRQRLRKQAKDLAAIERDKARLKDYMEGRDNGGRPDVTPDEILQVWNSNASRDSDPQLYEYVARLTPPQKKELVRSAMRDKLPEWLNFQRRLTEQPQTVTKSEKQFYHDLLKAEIEKRNLFWLEELKAEAESLIAWWHGQERMPEYFKTSVEMYAEMGNVLLNNPAAVRERAPKYYDAFMRYLDAKPEFAKNYREIQELMRTGNVQATRAKNIEDMLDRQEAWGHEADMNQRTKREHLNNLLRLFGREESAVLSYLDKGSPEIARAKMAMGNFRYRDSAVELMLRKVNEQVIRPLKEADLTLRDLSLYSLHQHVFHNRADIASTLGMNPKASAEQLDQLRKSMTDEQWQVLEQARQTWSAVRREQIIEPLMQAGVLKPETEQILLDRDFYVTFAKGLDAKPNRIAQNLDDLMQANYGRQVSSGIYQQHGYMGEIKDPVTATLQKDIALVRMAKREQAKKAVVREMLREGSPFIEEAKYTFDGKARVPIEVNGSRVGTIQLLDRGQRKAYYVPEAVASFFNSEDPLNDWMFNMITIPNRITKALFTQNNPGFVPVAFIRDVGAAIMQLPEARASDILPLIPSSMMDAARGFLGGDAPYTEQGLKRGVLISRATPKGEQMGLVPGSEALMLQFGINPRAGRNEKLPPAERFGKAWNMIFMPGQIAERTMKIVGMRYLDQKFPNMPEGEKQEMIREWAGSPDFLNRGARNALMESAVGLYYNAAREGARSSGKKVYKDPWSVGVNFLKYVAGPAGLMLAAEMGMFGKDLEEQMGAISEYDKTNYITVPMGWADKDQRKVRVLRLPLFEGWKWMHGASRKMAQTAIEQQAEPLGQLKEFAGDQIPIGNPFMDSMSALWTFYGSGGNPYDNFRNRPVIGEDEMLTGQGDDAQLWAHVWNNLGGGLVYRFNEPTLYAEETALESGLNKPFVQSTLGRFLKVTNQGWKEQIRDTSAPVEKQRAQDRMRVEEILREMYKAGRDEPTEKQWQWIEAEPYRIEHLKSKWRRTERMRDDFEYQLLNLAPSKDSKAAVLESGLLD